MSTISDDFQTTGHLHNAQFLEAVGLAGGLGKVKNLAIHEDVWAETMARHGDEWRQYKSYSPMAVYQQLGVEHLTIAGKPGFFRDGAEFATEVDERDWLWNDDSELDDVREQPEDDSEDDSEDDLEEEVRLYGGSGQAIYQTAGNFANSLTSTQRSIDQREETRSSKGLRPHGDSSILIRQSNEMNRVTQFDHHQPGEEETDDDGYDADNTDYGSGNDDLEKGDLENEDSDLISVMSETSDDSIDVVDRFSCNGPIVGGEDPRLYKPRAVDGKLGDHRIPSGESGLALVNFSTVIAAGRHLLWKNLSKTFYDESAIKEAYLAKLAKVKQPHTQYFAEDNDPTSDNYID
ncbi:hypothetical protein SBOR_8217 [Sclerotinia borealis F-4128]|uniref:Uncharacterized protein n=1 Tax=Sclerotinia borealis (strain F-4128) TaxID=1432307 RepID=W9C6Q2_SCLBF|nr:hypothetical protein SBOR_8217 [Sclerotinia borealis F-4128]